MIARPAWAESNAFPINVHRGPMASSLQELARQSGTELLHDLNLVRGRQTVGRRQQDTEERVGFVDEPLKWRANGGAKWTVGRTMIGANLQFFGKYWIAVSELLFEADYNEGPQGSKYVKAQAYIDLYKPTLQYPLGWQRSRDERRFPVINLLGHTPPYQADPDLGGAQYSFYGDPHQSRFELTPNAKFWANHHPQRRRKKRHARCQQPQARPHDEIPPRRIGRRGMASREWTRIAVRISSSSAWSKQDQTSLARFRACLWLSCATSQFSSVSLKPARQCATKQAATKSGAIFPRRSPLTVSSSMAHFDFLDEGRSALIERFITALTQLPNLMLGPRQDNVPAEARSTLHLSISNFVLYRII